ncbi:hypothetical protein GDO86_003495 [Hymenochirus boettgeri]|uniref:Uncharacterized protein n=1 Tax=Hymenochirus boettgeri TaxID=247094 RepID=A0A8T2K6L8_9PIPI|nr:hypothetical protein GDO86_003495 [Hymenochirus boettgeri]
MLLPMAIYLEDTSGIKFQRMCIWDWSFFFFFFKTTCMLKCFRFYLICHTYWVKIKSLLQRTDSSAWSLGT